MRRREIALVALGLLAACSRAPGRPNVLLITLDTTRADRLGCYGYTGAATETLDALAQSGVRFERAYAQVPLTLASHASLLTGTYPAVNGMHVNAGARLGPTLPTLAEAFAAQGYRTGAFVSSFVLDGAFGLSRGFARYDDDLQSGTDAERFRVERPADRVTDSALAWLGEAPRDPFFAWVHYYDPHSPHQAQPDYASRLPDPYDAEIAFVDDQIERLVGWLRSRGLLDDTIVVVVGDHGESFGEHGEPEHGLFVYDTTVRVPLIVSWPGSIEAPAVRQADVALVDLFPTLVELAGIEAHGRHDGQSLAPVLAAEPGADAAREIYGESRCGQIGYGWAPLRFLVHDGLKYVAAPRPELYDLRADPGELRDLTAERPSDARALLERLERLEAALVPVEAEAVDLDPASRAKLEQLGYVVPPSGSAATPTETSAARDPKDMLEVFRGHTRARGLLGAGRFDQAAALSERLVEASPTSWDLYEDLGFAYLSLDRPVDAERAYRLSLTNLPEHPERLWGLGEALRRQNRFDEAIERFQASLERRPRFGEAHLGLTLSLEARGELPAALEHARRYSELNPGSAIAWNNLATLASQSGLADEAVAASTKLLELAPSDPQAHYLHWETLRSAGRRAEDLAALRRAREAFPTEWLFKCLLAWRLAVTPDGDPARLDEALTLAREAASENEAHPRGQDTLAAVLAARGSYAEAVVAQEHALALAEGAGDAQLAGEMRERLALYREGKPYRE